MIAAGFERNFSFPGTTPVDSAGCELKSFVLGATPSELVSAYSPPQGTPVDSAGCESKSSALGATPLLVA